MQRGQHSVAQLFGQQRFFGQQWIVRRLAANSAFGRLGRRVIGQCLNFSPLDGIVRQ